MKEPSLSQEERALFDKGVREFNAGYFFECHDTLEELWAGLRGEARDFFQGLIQVSVGFYHLGRGNAEGAVSMLERALTRFGKYPDRYFGFDLSAHRGELRDWAARARGGATEPPLDSVPKWRFDLP
ncbi:MAG TPA: DUF309 domain-containing protein [Vicinamibacteria bacterium]|nr:DUF309 domain-containing protein [Vicinamibacteria bacterium]